MKIRISRFVTQEIFTKGLIGLAFRMLAILFNFLLSVVIGRFYGISSLGVLFISLSFLQIMSLMIRSGQETLILKKHGLDFIPLENTLSTVLKNVFIMSFMVVGILLIFQHEIFNLLYDSVQHKEQFYLIILAIPPFSLAFIVIENLRADKNILAYSIFKEFARFFLLTICVVFCYFLFDYRPDIFLLLLGVSIVVFLLLLPFVNNIGLLFKKINLSVAWRVILDSFPYFQINLLNLLANHAWVFIISFTMLDSDAAVFGVNYRISSLLTVPLIAFNGIAAPKFGEYFRKNQISELTKAYKHTNRIILLISGLIMTIIILLQSFIWKLFNFDIESGNNYILIIMMIAQLINAGCGSVGFLLLMTNNQNSYSKILLLSFIISITIALFLVGNLGLYAIALGFALNLALVNIASSVMVSKIFKTWPL